MHASILKKDLETWASYLLDYSLGGIKPEDIVMIKATRGGWKLLD